MTYDLIIIGGGPAGITAGIYAARKKLKTLLITKGFSGQLQKTASIENYPGFYQISGIKLIENFTEHLRRFEIEIKEEEVREIRKKENNFEVLTTKGSYLARAIIIASGRDPRRLKIPGEEKFIGKGISFCEICDGPLFKNKEVAVIGGGNAGFEAALDLTKYCPKVYILESLTQARADEVTQEKVKKSSKVLIITSAQVKEIKGRHPPTTRGAFQEGGGGVGVPAKGAAPNFVEGLVYQDKTSGEIKELKVKGIFVEIGSIPSVAFAKDLVDFNEFGEIRIDSESCQTKTPGIFAAGDVTTVKYKQIIVAAGEGAKAALAAYDYLQKQK